MWRELVHSPRRSYLRRFPLRSEWHSNRKANSGDPMDLSLFQFFALGLSNSPRPIGISGVRAATWPVRCIGRTNPMGKWTANSRNLDLLRSFAVILVVGFHLAKFF